MCTAVAEMCQYNIEPRKETWFKHELTQMRPALLGCDLFTNASIVILVHCYVAYHIFRTRNVNI